MSTEFLELANLDPVVGSEQGRTRPVLVISDTSLNEILPVVNVIPITSRKPNRRVYPNEAVIKFKRGQLALLLGVRRPVAALVFGGLTPRTVTRFKRVVMATGRHGPKRRQVGALQGVEWRVWLANLDPVVGSEQGRTRPIILVSDSSPYTGSCFHLGSWDVN